MQRHKHCYSSPYDHDSIDDNETLYQSLPNNFGIFSSDVGLAIFWAKRVVFPHVGSYLLAPFEVRK